MLPLCQAFCAIPDVEFTFIATKEITKSRIKLGYTDFNELYDFVIKPYKSQEEKLKAEKLCIDSDVLIMGMAPVSMIKERLNRGKLTFRYSERVYKKKCPWYELPVRAIKYYFEIERHKNLYLLCASAYTAGDYAKTGTFKNRTFKWGYFPETKKYDIDKLLSEKTNNSILWAGRFIDWKHPEMPVYLAKELKAKGYEFNLNMIGTGDMDDEINALIERENLSENVHLLGSMKPEKVREYMEKSKIFLSTSDRQEGWGAVLNEAMNSGCATVANSAVGSAPYLIEDGKNGFLYKDGNLDSLCEKVKRLLDDPDMCNNFGEKAYRTMDDTWNAKVAAERLIRLSEALLNKKSSDDLYSDGPCSKAPIIKDNWYK